MLNLMLRFRELDFSNPWTWVSLAVTLGLALVAYYRSTWRREESGTEVAEVDPGWHPPKELSVPVPRPVQAQAMTVAAMVGIGILTAVPVILLGAVGVSAGEFYFHEKDASIILVGVSLIFFLAALGVAALYVRTFNGPRSLLRWGKPARGIVSLARTPGNTGSVLNVRYQFKDASGNLIHGKSQVRTPVEDVITVLYDPKKPKRNCGYPVPGFDLLPEES